MAPSAKNHLQVKVAAAISITPPPGDTDTGKDTDTDTGTDIASWLALLPRIYLTRRAERLNRLLPELTGKDS